MLKVYLQPHRRLRNHYLSTDDKYKVDLTTIKSTEQDLTVRLINGKKDELQLQVTWSENGARLLLKEPNSTRFILPGGYSLQVEPEKSR